MELKLVPDKDTLHESMGISEERRLELAGIMMGITREQLTEDKRHDVSLFFYELAKSLNGPEELVFCAYVHTIYLTRSTMTQIDKRTKSAGL